MRKGWDGLFIYSAIFSLAIHVIMLPVESQPWCYILMHNTASVKHSLILTYIISSCREPSTAPIQVKFRYENGSKNTLFQMHSFGLLSWIYISCKFFHSDWRYSKDKSRCRCKSPRTPGSMILWCTLRNHTQGRLFKWLLCCLFGSKEHHGFFALWIMNSSNHNPKIIMYWGVNLAKTVLILHAKSIWRKVVTYRTSKCHGVVDVYKLAPTPVGHLCLLPVSFGIW